MNRDDVTITAATRPSTALGTADPGAWPTPAHEVEDTPLWRAMSALGTDKEQQEFAAWLVLLRSDQDDPYEISIGHVRDVTKDILGTILKPKAGDNLTAWRKVVTLHRNRQLNEADPAAQERFHRLQALARLALEEYDRYLAEQEIAEQWPGDDDDEAHGLAYSAPFSLTTQWGGANHDMRTPTHPDPLAKLDPRLGHEPDQESVGPTDQAPTEDALDPEWITEELDLGRHTDDGVAQPESAPVNPWVSAAFYVAAVATLPTSLNTSWRFFEHVMHVTDMSHRIGMAAVMELALIACAIGMAATVKWREKENARRRKEGLQEVSGGGGAYQLVVWGICIFSGWTAFHMSDSLGEGVGRVVLGPVIGVIMLHLALGLLRRGGGEKSKSVFARLGEELRERALSRLGLADDERTAAQRTRDRAATRAVQLSMQRLVPFGRKWKLRRALIRSGAARDRKIMNNLLAEQALLLRADELATLDQGSPWT